MEKQREVFGFPVSAAEYEEFKAAIESPGWDIIVRIIEKMMAGTAENNIRTKQTDHEAGVHRGTFLTLEDFKELREAHRTEDLVSQK